MRFRCLAQCLPFCLMLVGFGGAPAIGEEIDQLSLEELLSVNVESAAQFAQPLSETPYPVTVISAQDIRRFAFRDLGEALQLGRGVYLTRDRAYTYMGVRGFSPPGDYNARILLMQDGARINDPLYDQASLGNESLLSLDWVKRLEYVSGPASASYGGNALFGVANAVLWNGSDINGVRLNVDAASGRSGQFGVLAGGVTDGGADWLVGLSLAESQGQDLYFREFDTLANNRGKALGLDGERYVKGLFKGSLDGWRTSLSFVSRTKEVPTAYYSTLFNVAGNYARDEAVHFDLSHSAILAPAWSQQVRLHLGYYNYEGEYPYSGYTNRDEAMAAWWRGEYRLTYTGLIGHKMLFGGEFTHSQKLEQRNFDIQPYVSHLEDSRQSLRGGLFFQDEWQLSARWLANAGLRLDQQSGMERMFSPRLSLIYRPIDALSTRFLVGQSFRYPNSYERYYHDGSVTQKANPDLKPERIRTVEVGADYMLAHGVRLGVGHFHYVIDDLIELINDPSDGLNVFRNHGDLSASGWDAELEAIAGNGWRMRTGISLVNTTGHGETVMNSPRHLGKLLLDGPLPWSDAWTMGLNLQGVGKRASQSGNAPGYVTTSLVLRQRQKAQGGAWSLAVYNLGGGRYWDPAGREFTQSLLPLDGRTWRVRWEYAF